MQAWFAKYPPAHARLPGMDMEEVNLMGNVGRDRDSANEGSGEQPSLVCLFVTTVSIACTACPEGLCELET